MTDKEKIIKYLDLKGISKNKFYIKTGFSVGFLDKGLTLGVDKLKIIIDKYPDFNHEWFLTGKGEMVNEPTGMVGEPKANYRLRTDSNQDLQTVPLYNIETSAGLVNLFHDSNNTTPIDTIHIPNLPKCDGAIYITGDSMYPLLKSGDIVAYKQINDFTSEIFWGEMYLISISIADEEFVSVKFIQKSSKGTNYITLVSENKHHQNKDIKISKIKAMALVKASIRINSMG